MKEKAAARKAVWDALTARGAARFPFPVHGRIPNFGGARQAAERLLAHPIFRRVKVIKVNPDSPQRWVRKLDPAKIPRLVVMGSVAVTRQGRRLGKGHGYADLEYAMLRELGNPAVPSLIATPDELLEVKHPPRAPRGIDWSLLPEEALQEMPALAERRELKRLRR